MHHNLERRFREREQQVLAMLTQSGIPYEAIGIFGSWARRESKGASDIDFFVIGEKPDPCIRGSVYSDAEELGADIVFVSRDFFLHDAGLFAQNLRRDAIFLIGGEQFEK